MKRFLVMTLTIFVLLMVGCDLLNIKSPTASDDGTIKSSSSKSQTSSKYSLVLEYMRTEVCSSQDEDVVRLLLKRDKKSFNIKMEKMEENRFRVVLKSVPTFQNNKVQIYDTKLDNGKKGSAFTGKSIYILTGDKKIKLIEKDKTCNFKIIGENNIIDNWKK